MKKFPIIEMPIEIPVEQPQKEENIFVVKGLENPTKPLEEGATGLGNVPRKEAKGRSAKQLAHLENIRAKALIARQNKAKAKTVEKSQAKTVEKSQAKTVEKSQAKTFEKSQSKGGITGSPCEGKHEEGGSRGTQDPLLYTKSQMDEYAKGALINYHTETRDKRIAEVRQKQAELEQHRKKYDVSSILKKTFPKGQSKGFW